MAVCRPASATEPAGTRSRGVAVPRRLESRRQQAEVREAWGEAEHEGGVRLRGVQADQLWSGEARASARAARGRGRARRRRRSAPRAAAGRAAPARAARRVAAGRGRPARMAARARAARAATGAPVRDSWRPSNGSRARSAATSRTRAFVAGSRLSPSSSVAAASPSGRTRGKLKRASASTRHAAALERLAYGARDRGRVRAVAVHAQRVRRELEPASLERQDDAVTREAQRALGRRSGGVVDRRARLRARQQASPVVVRAVDERLAGEAQPRRRRGGAQHGGAGEAHERHAAAEPRHGPRDRVRQRLVTRGLVVQRPVRFHVREPRPVAARESGERARLVKHVRLDLGGRRCELAPAEPAQVRVAGVRADGYASAHARARPSGRSRSDRRRGSRRPRSPTSRARAARRPPPSSRRRTIRRRRR